MEKFFGFLKEFDFFGKLPEFYFKRKPKQATTIGRILTFIYIFIYIILLIYKLYRMSIRIDITFYDSYSNTDEIPIIHITKKNFSIFISIYNDSNLPFIDESIYYPVAYFNGEESKEIDIVRCDFDKIGSKYKQFFSDKEINNYYCLNNIDFILKPYENSIFVELYPCKNTTENNNHCKPKELIEENLNNKLLKIFFEDIDITPLNYDNPIKEKLNFLDAGTYNNFGLYLYSEMQYIRIETSTNIIGFDFFSNPKIDEYIKFDNVELFTVPGFNLDDESNNNSVCGIEFQLNDKTLMEKRYYSSLIDILGDIGGFMEIINTFFGLICSFFGDIIYERTIVNSLFLFDINKKIISFKNKDEKNLKTTGTLNEKRSIKNQNMFMHNINNMDIKDINNKINENYLKNKRNKRSRTLKIDIMNNNVIYSAKSGSIDNTKIRFVSSLNLNKNNKIIDNDDSWIFNKLKKEKNKDLLIPICKCCKRKKDSVNIILFNKSMDIITEKLDIFNIFRNMYLIEKNNNNIKYDLDFR